TVTITAENSAGLATCTAIVTVTDNFTGFFSPVSNLPALNSVNAGRAIPVKFSLNGNRGLDIFAAGSPASGVIACDASATPVEITETLTAGGSSLQYDAASDTYTYVWKTEKSWAGTCRQLVLQLKTGCVYRANFKFK
ncbi:MAG TPA: PxKF domain-containing protein, partial [Blastocatellia bacterium]|nr:PxKF domain-containing protein [Blastocatellia bacterium]